MQNTSVSRSNGAYRVLADINVTPLVDVMLVLLIIFMVTAPMMATGLHVNLPQAKAAARLDPKPPVVLTYRRDGRIDLDGQTFALAEILPVVEAKIGADRMQAIHLRADRDASYGDIVTLMDLLASHGLTRLAVLTGRPDRSSAAAGSPRP